MGKNPHHIFTANRLVLKGKALTGKHWRKALWYWVIETFLRAKPEPQEEVRLHQNELPSFKSTIKRLKTGRICANHKPDKGQACVRTKKMVKTMTRRKRSKVEQSFHQRRNKVVKMLGIIIYEGNVNMKPL